MKKNIIYTLILSLLSLYACDYVKENEEHKNGSDQNNTEIRPQEKNHLSDTQIGEYLKLGDSIAGTAFQTLSGELKAAMGRGGVKEAVAYCNVEAYPLTDSVGEQFGVELMRVAEKYRNPDNALTDFDEKQFAEMKAGEEKLLKLHQGNAVYYKRIDLAPQCLSCHGDPGADIADPDYALIKEKYPDDQAIGFQPGDLRGMWKITFSLSD
mgnify:CR=1 FL=1